MSSNGPKEISSTQIVLEAARDLHDLKQPVTREALVAATGLTLYIIDERLRVLKNDGLMDHLGRGKYQPAAVFHEPRPISKTILSGGLIKYEIGDHVLELSPHEDRVLSELTAGALTKLVGIEGNQQAGGMHDRLAMRLEQLEKIVRDRDRRSTSKAKPKEKTEA